MNCSPIVTELADEQDQIDRANPVDQPCIGEKIGNADLADDVMAVGNETLGW